MNKKVLIIGLGTQGEQYIRYFLKKGYLVSGICRTLKTQKHISHTYNISVSTDLPQDFSVYEKIIIAISPDEQGELCLSILKTGYNKDLLIETPVTWNKGTLSAVKEYDNVIFFLEEYYTLLSQFLRRIEIEAISKIFITLYISREDYENIYSREVAHMHVRNNFLPFSFSGDILEYNYVFKDTSKIFYNLTFEYKGKQIEYNFDEEKYLQIGDKTYRDTFCFDTALEKILTERPVINSYYSLNI